ncbi:MAG: NAD-dependent epimerase/dehydratase family protein [Phycisphaerales bacterium]|nr:MAG: NAD-dependent epimerase/dehydratase family protein [Phycisphaerales bacterium]
MLRLPAQAVQRLRPFYEGRACLVTGGAGFIGGHLTDALLGLGASVCVIDDLSNATPAHLGELLDLDPDRLRVVHASILDPSGLADAAEGADRVFHLAAVGSVQRSIEAPERTWQVNATGTLRVLEAARAVGAGRVVFAASSSAYGDVQQFPTPETLRPSPRSPYAASKVAAEQLLAAWSRTYGLSTVALRYFNIFGPRQRADSEYAAVVAAFATRLLAGERPRIYGDGNQSRDFTHVSNAVLATLLAGASTVPLAGEVCNVAAGERTSVNELARIMARVLDAHGLEPIHDERRPGDVLHSHADLTRTRELLGYTPCTTVEQGLADTLAWYRSAQHA